MSTKEIKTALKKILDPNQEIYGIPCTVDSVDVTARTCYCIPIETGKADLIDVRLIADTDKKGFLIIPKVGSVVFVTMINNEAGYVSMFSEVSEIQLNGDNYNGLIKVVDLLNEINTRNTTLKTAITTALTSIDAAIVSLGGASTSSAAFTAATTTITNILKATVENTTVKHGNG